MGKKDTVTKLFMQDNSIFADAFNAALFDGEQMLDPSKLTTVDPTEIGLPYGKDSLSDPVQKARDLIRCATIKQDGQAVYLMAGIENQSQVHYAMPVRNLLYDMLQYTRQVEMIAEDHRKKKSVRSRSSAEFLSGFYKSDHLIPVITLVIYFSPKRWDGPRSIREMMGINNPRILSRVPDYEISLLEPAAMCAEDFQKFKTDLGPVLHFIKDSQNKSKLQKMVHEDSRFLDLDRRAAQVLEMLTKIKLDIDNNEEEINMCKALRDMMKDSKKEGVEEGIKEERIRSIQSIMESFHVPLEQAMTALKLSAEEREYCQKALASSAG